MADKQMRGSPGHAKAVWDMFWGARHCFRRQEEFEWEINRRTTA